LPLMPEADLTGPCVVVAAHGAAPSLFRSPMKAA